MNALVSEAFRPFNDVLYKNCFYNQLFTCMNYLSASYYPILMNDVYYYADEKTSFRLESLSIKKEDDILKSVGICMEEKAYSTDFRSHVLGCLKKGSCAIVFIDCYYYPLKRDNYLRLHNPHAVSVIGCDFENKLLRIVDHNFETSLHYVEQTIDISCLERCCQEYNQFFKREISWYEIYKTAPTETDRDCKAGLYWNYSRYMKNIRDGMNRLGSFFDFYKSSVLCPQRLQEVIDPLSACITEIFQKIKARRYQFIKIGDLADPEITLLDNIVENWGYVYAVLGKYTLNSAYRESSFLFSIEKTQKILTAEEDWLNCLEKKTIWYTGQNS